VRSRKTLTVYSHENRGWLLRCRRFSIGTMSPAAPGTEELS
jgi:hypothetical protein